MAFYQNDCFLLHCRKRNCKIVECTGNKAEVEECNAGVCAVEGGNGRLLDISKQQFLRALFYRHTDSRPTVYSGGSYFQGHRGKIAS